jgi:hypothetical protein
MPLGAASSNYTIGVELLKGDVGLPAYTLLPNSEYYCDYLGSESASDNVRGGDMSAFRDVLMNNNRHTLGYVQDHNIVAALLSATTCRPGDAEKQDNF